MPNYFTLTRKDNLEAGPVDFTVIDEEICQHLNVPVHEVNWCNGWYDSIGLALAMGKSWDDMRNIWKSDESATTRDIIDYLEKHFVPNAWYQVRR